MNLQLMRVRKTHAPVETFLHSKPPSLPLPHPLGHPHNKLSSTDIVDPSWLLVVFTALKTHLADVVEVAQEEHKCPGSGTVGLVT